MPARRSGLRCAPLLVALATLTAACRSREGKVDARGDAWAAASASAVPSASAAMFRSLDRGAWLVAEACLSCHSDEMLRQQRLLPGQWEKVVKKMAGWGANLDADDAPIVTAYLAASYGPDAGAFQPETIAASFALRETAAMDDGAFAEGRAERGGTLFAARCAACHGVDARGQIGVNLVDRPLLGRAADFAHTIHEGRAKMPAQPNTTTEEIADLLAYLRGRRAGR
jgi:mono/diheme cytochrome c family protein